MENEIQRLQSINNELVATIAELTTDGNAATLAANLAKASKRNAELESNCRDLRVAYEQNASQCVQLNRELALKSDTVEWLNGVTIQRQRAEQAEAHIADLVAALDDLLECPTVTDRATCPNGDPSRIDEAPEWQAVLQISCAWTRYKKLKALARANQFAVECRRASDMEAARLHKHDAEGFRLVARVANKELRRRGEALT